LITTFEDLKADLPGEVKRIADFLSTNELRYDTKERIKAAIDRSTYAYMNEHESQFDEKLSKSTRNEACGLSANAGMSGGKIRAGTTQKFLSDSLTSQITQTWTDVVTPVTGCTSYPEL
jgi:hypothetical protein